MRKERSQVNVTRVNMTRGGGGSRSRKAMEDSLERRLKDARKQAQAHLMAPP